MLLARSTRSRKPQIVSGCAFLLRPRQHGAVALHRPAYYGIATRTLARPSPIDRLMILPGGVDRLSAVLQLNEIHTRTQTMGEAQLLHAGGEVSLVGSNIQHERVASGGLPV